MTILDLDGRIVDVFADGENYFITVFDGDGSRVIELGDRDAALRFARDLFLAALDKDD